MKNNKRKKKYLGTTLQNKLLILIFGSAVIPAAIIGICMYYLIFTLMALQMVIPELIVYNLVPVLHKINLIIAIAVPVILLLVWFIALELSHRIVGPVYRMERELDERISGAKSGPINLRKNDEFKAFAEKLNQLICK